MQFSAKDGRQPGRYKACLVEQFDQPGRVGDWYQEGSGVYTYTSRLSACQQGKSEKV